MLRIRKIYDDVSPANRDAIRQVAEIMRNQFPLTSEADLARLPKQLRDPMAFRYRSVLFITEDARANVRGFALLLHLADLRICYLEFISAAPGSTGGGIGGVLYERVREEAQRLGSVGLFFECNVDDPALEPDPTRRAQSAARLRFYERYGARPIMNNDYATPVRPGDQDLYYLVYDGLGQSAPPARELVRSAVRAILARKYGHLFSAEHVERIALSFTDDPVVLRPARQARTTAVAKRPARAGRVRRPIALIVNEGHEIHHVRDRGYVEAPVRIGAILQEIRKTGLFEPIAPRRSAERWLKQVHDPSYVRYLQSASAALPMGKSIYPIIFPLRNTLRPPKDMELRVGYYCMDTFTPLHRNVFLAARGAVDCALTGADALLDGYRFAYALVRPPGHHAERAAFGGFCYFNSAAVAAHFLSQYGKVAVLDIDFHHGNGTQEIFYERADVYTISIHGDPHFAYPHFSGFPDERGRGIGEGYNLNLPLTERATPARYRRALATALATIREFDPTYVVLSLGLDTAKADPTGTWTLAAEDFRRNGEMIRALDLPILIVQEGGYRTRTLGVNARHFFEGLAGSIERVESSAAGRGVL